MVLMVLILDAMTTHDRDVISLTHGPDPIITYVRRDEDVFTVTDPVGMLTLTETASFEVEACGDKSGLPRRHGHVQLR